MTDNSHGRIRSAYERRCAARSLESRKDSGHRRRSRAAAARNDYESCAANETRRRDLRLLPQRAGTHSGRRLRACALKITFCSTRRPKPARRRLCASGPLHHRRRRDPRRRHGTDIFVWSGGSQGDRYCGAGAECRRRIIGSRMFRPASFWWRQFPRRVRTGFEFTARPGTRMRLRQRSRGRAQSRRPSRMPRPCASRTSFRGTAATSRSIHCRRKPSRCTRCISKKAAIWDRRLWSASGRAGTSTGC